MPQGQEQQRDETLVDQLQKVVEALVADDRKSAAREIKPIKFKPSEPAPPRKQLTATEQARCSGGTHSSVAIARPAPSHAPFYG